MSIGLRMGLIAGLGVAGACVSTVAGLISFGRGLTPPLLVEWQVYPGAWASTWADPSQRGLQRALFLFGSFAAWALAGVVIVTGVSVWRSRRPAR